MHAAIKLVTKAMHFDLGWAIANQVDRVVYHGARSDINPNAMRQAVAWFAKHAQDLQLAFSDDAWEEIEYLAAQIEGLAELNECAHGEVAI